MLETVIILKPKELWRSVDTWYTDWAPDWLKPVLRRSTPGSYQPRTAGQRTQRGPVVARPGQWLDHADQGPDRYAHHRHPHPIDLKISSADVATVETIGTKVEALLPTIKGTRSAFAERTGSGYFLDITWDREQLAFAGLTLTEAQAVVQNVIGGETVTTKIESRERYSVNVRYQSDFRKDLPALQRVAQRLEVVVPVTFFLILLLFYLNSRSLTKTGIILLAVPFSAIGALWLLYLDIAYEQAKKEGYAHYRSCAPLSWKGR